MKKDESSKVKKISVQELEKELKRENYRSKYFKILTSEFLDII